MAEHYIGERTPRLGVAVKPTAVHAGVTTRLSLAENARTRRSIMSCIGGGFSPARGDPINPRRGNLPAGRHRSSRRPAFADQPQRLWRAKFSTRSAAAATLSAGLVIRVANSRARVTYCGARMVRRSATSDSRVVLVKRRAVPTFSRLTRAPQSVPELPLKPSDHTHVPGRAAVEHDGYR